MRATGRSRWQTALGLARLTAGGALLAAGAVVLLPAQSTRMWMLSVALIEYGHWLAPAALVLLWPGWHRTWPGRIGAFAGVIAAACLLTPLVRALPVAQQLPRRLEAAFGPRALRPPSNETASRARPVDALSLFGGVHVPDVAVTRLTYAQRGALAMSLDLYALDRVPGGPPVPIIVMVHGGGWNSGKRDDWLHLVRYLAAHGYLVATPEYRLAPEHRFPAAADDVRDAMAFLRGRATTWGGDPDGLVLIGRSAGAHLALLVGYTSRLNAVRGVVSLYGPADLRFGWEHPGNRWVYDGVGAIEAFLGGPPSVVPDAYRASSAYDLVGPATPPTLLIHGRKDELVWVEQSRRLAQRLGEAGRAHLLVELPWATHGCDVAVAGPCGQITLYAVERFLAAVTAH
jgi:acetyl esterase/lipase